MTIAATPAVDGAIKAARDLPDLINRLKQVDPEAAEQFTGKALAASRTLWGGVATIAITWVVAHFQLGWGADLITLMAGALVIGGLRVATSAPISHLYRKAQSP